MLKKLFFFTLFMVINSSIAETNGQEAEMLASSLPYNSQGLLLERPTYSVYQAGTPSCKKNWRKRVQIELNAVFKVTRNFEFTSSYIKERFPKDVLIALAEKVCPGSEFGKTSSNPDVEVSIYVDGVHLSGVNIAPRDRSFLYHVTDKSSTSKNEMSIIHFGIEGNLAEPYFGDSVMGTENAWLRVFGKREKNEFHPALASIDKYLEFNNFVISKYRSGVSSSEYLQNQRDERYRKTEKELKKYNIKFRSGLLEAWVLGEKYAWEDYYIGRRKTDIHISDSSTNVLIRNDYIDMLTLYFYLTSMICERNSIQPSISKSMDLVNYERGSKEVTGQTKEVFHSSVAIREFLKKAEIVFHPDLYEVTERQFIKYGVSDYSYKSNRDYYDIGKDFQEIIEVKGCAPEVFKRFEKNIIENSIIDFSNPHATKMIGRMR